ncbi:MAG: antitoxin [Nocardioidaceae bacterium]|nr:antitoxin [Nocardioidaceae bacterium]
MGILDKFKGTANSLRKSADKALDQHGDKIATGVDKAGGAVNKATKGKYADKVDKGVGLAKKPLVKDAAAPGAAGTGLAGDPVDPSDPMATTPPPPMPSASDPVIDDGTTDPKPPGTSGGSMPGTPPASSP